MTLRKNFLLLVVIAGKMGRVSTPKGRKVIGKKGLGKLSFFGIVRTITVDTVRQGKRNVFTMDWDDLMESAGGRYLVTPTVFDEVAAADETGTQITLANINRESDFSEEFLANSIARFFIFDDDFSVTITRNNEDAVTLSNEMHFSVFGEEFSWSFPQDFVHIESDYEHRSKIQGKIITPIKPIAPRFHSRGISLFARGKLVQSPYQFADSTSSHFFSYMTGWLKVDFIDDFSEDVIATNRQNINWGHIQTGKLHKYLAKCVQYVQLDWRKKRGHKKITNVNNNLKDIKLEEWKESIPEHLQDSFGNIVRQIIENLPEVESDEAKQFFNEFIKIIPPYSYYHWRNLHPIIKDRLYDDYRNKKYLEAAKEGVSLYEGKVKNELKLDFSGVDLMNQAFSYKGNIENGKPEISKPPKLQISKMSQSN